MATQNKKDAVDIFHEYGLHIPSRTIMLETSHDEEGNETGVNSVMANKFLKNLHILKSLNKDPITILLDTMGGSCVAGMAIYDAIKKSDEHHITIKVTGQASSMGCWILQAADERVAARHASIMFHAGSGGVGSFNPYEVSNSAEYDKKWMEEMYKIIFDRINEKRIKNNQAEMSWKTFETMNLKGKYMGAKEALEMGLLDRIE